MERTGKCGARKGVISFLYSDGKHVAEELQHKIGQYARKTRRVGPPGE